MARRRQLSDSDRIRIAAQRYTQKELGALLGRSDRQVRRYLRGDAVPPPDVHKLLVREANKVRSYLKDRGAPNVPVPFATMERYSTKYGRRVTETQTAIPGARANLQDMHDAIAWARDNGASGVRAIVRVPKSPDYPEGILSTEMQNISEMDDADIADFLMQWGSGGKTIKSIWTYY